MSEETRKGACVKCGEHIAFPESHAGNKVPCPHCRAMTPLIPGKLTAEGLFYKCLCTVCWVKIEYHARLIGSAVPCPHCKQSTVLAAPGSQSRPLGAPGAAATVAPASSIAQKTPVEPMAAVHAAAAAAQPAVPPVAASGPKPVTPGAKPVMPGAKPVTPAAKPVMPGGLAKPAATAPVAAARSVSPDRPATLVDPVPGPMVNPPPPPSMPRARVEAVGTGAKTRPKWLLPVAISVGVLVILGVAAVLISKFLGKGGNAPTADLTIVDYRFQTQADTGVIYVVGTVTNHAAAQAFNVKVQFELFDQGNNKLGVTQDIKDVIEARGTWKFKAIVTDKTSEDARPLPITKD